MGGSLKRAVAAAAPGSTGAASTAGGGGGGSGDGGKDLAAPVRRHTEDGRGGWEGRGEGADGFRLERPGGTESEELSAFRTVVAVARRTAVSREAVGSRSGHDAVDLTGDDGSEADTTAPAIAGNEAARAPPSARPAPVTTSEREEAPPVADGVLSTADRWSVGNVVALLRDCGFDTAAAGALAARTDGGALVEMLSCKAGRRVLQLPVAEGGLGLTEAQEFRLRSEVRIRGVVLPPPE